MRYAWTRDEPLLAIENLAIAAGERVFLGTDATTYRGSWGQSQIDLSGYARGGDTLVVRFDFGTDGCNGQDGWYVEPSYRFSDKWGIYARYEDVDAARDQDKFTQNEFGINYWPVPGVVLKIDYRMRDHSLSALADEDFDAIDLGFGYNF